MTVNTGSRNTRGSAEAFLWALLLWVAGPALAGCQLGGLRVEPLAVSVQPPAQVAVFVSVRDAAGSVADLRPENFQLFEDGKPLDPTEVNQKLLARDVAAEHHVLVLVDVGGPIEEPGAKALLAQQLAPFVERLRLQQSVSIYGFDGEAALYPFAQFDKVTAGAPNQPPAKEALKAITLHKQKDSSRNLNGAALAAMTQLRHNLGAIRKPIRIGSLVLVTRGPDLAGRVKDDELENGLDDAEFNVYSLVIGKDEKASEALAERLGKDGHETTHRFEDLDTVLGNVANLLERDYNRYYLVSYCSPARAGSRTLLLQVKHQDAVGEEQVGSTEVEFSATGFGSGCDSARPPSFSYSRANAPIAGSARPAVGANEKATSNADSAEWYGGESQPPARPGTGQPGKPEAPEAPVVPPPDQPGYAE